MSSQTSGPLARGCCARAGALAATAAPPAAAARTARRVVLSSCCMVVLLSWWFRWRDRHELYRAAAATPQADSGTRMAARIAAPAHGRYGGRGMGTQPMLSV